MKSGRFIWILMVSLALVLQGVTSNQLFPNDRSFVFDWKVKFNTGAMLPSKIIVNVTGSHNINDTSLLNKPFRVNYTRGYIKDLYIAPDELPWSANMKRSVASIFQVNLDLLKTKALVSSGREGKYHSQYYLN
ncbi:hypothetical protein M8J75_011078 [Diaphorina citri]|nr:hypothetical protein M8J75_011078 [Diaphorina citri]